MFSPLEKFLEYEKQLANRLFLHQPMGEGKVHTYTWQQAGREARCLASALSSLGLQKGDRVAILSKNCAQWVVADIAIMMGGFVSVPLYPTITAQTIEQLLVHSGSKAVFVGKLDNFSAQQAGIPAGVASIHIAAYGTKGNYQWEQLIAQHLPLENPVLPAPSDLMTIMYTSGTTGKPKGVMHTVESFITTQGCLGYLGVPAHQRVFSYLPLCHIAERMGLEMATIFQGGSMYFAHSLESFPSDLQAAQPDLFFAVPRIWAKFREKINEKLPEAKLQRMLGLPLIGWLVRRKVKKGLGLSKAVRIFSGAAPISVEMMEWYQKLGIEILQAYGMTEDCIFGHFNLPGANKLGTVGRPVPGAEVRISDEGEIQVRHKALMQGYYREPDLTAEVFTTDGFLKTGDIGSYDSEGFLTITGRLKDQFKTDKGKYISPSGIELALATHTWIEQVCVVGMGIPQPIGLMVLGPEAPVDDRQRVETSLEGHMMSLNATLAAHERIEKLVIMQEPWTVENNLLTPTLKVKRNELEKIYVGRYPEWYQMEGRIVWL